MGQGRKLHRSRDTGKTRPARAGVVPGHHVPVTCSCFAPLDVKLQGLQDEGCFGIVGQLLAPVPGAWPQLDAPQVPKGETKGKSM